MHDACLAISRGEREVVLVTGAEAMYARALARRDPARPWLEWASQPEGTPPAALFGEERPGATELEMQRGVVLPVHAYPLFENALRAANGWTLPEHRAAHRRPVVALQRGGGGQPARVDPPGPDARRDRHARARQPDGVVPLPQALHGQHAGRPGRGLHRVLGRGRPRRRRARGALGLPALRRRRQRPLVHFRASRAAPLPRHPAGRCRRPRGGRSGHRRHRPGGPLLVLPRRGADGGGRAGPRPRRPGPPVDLDRRADVRRRPRQQLRHARHRPGRRRAAARTRTARHSSAAWAGTPPSIPWGSTPPARRRTAAAGPSPGATCSPTSTRCRAAPSIPTPPAPSTSRPTPSPSTARAPPSAASSPAAPPSGSRAWANVSDADAPGPALRRGGHRPAPATWPPTAP